MIYILLVIGFAFCVLDIHDLVGDRSIVKKVNSDPTLHWKARHYRQFEMIRVKEFRSTKLVKPMRRNQKRGKFVTNTRRSIPDSFDTYNQWPQCKKPIQDQGEMGSSVDFSACEVMSDRFCVVGDDVGELSALYIQECAPKAKFVEDAWEFLQYNGTVSTACIPDDDYGDCPTKCKDGSDLQLFKIESYTHYSSVEDAQNDMLTYGSIEATFEVYQDFMYYESGVYEHKYGSLAGDTAVKIQGWGVDSSSSLPYWNVANSWGPEWGMRGYFWIVRGQDECGIEDFLYGGVPDTSD